MIHQARALCRRSTCFAIVALVIVNLLPPAMGQEPHPATENFPADLVDWVPYAGNPIFSGTGQDTWDRQIRERGFILRQADTWHLWYTGYNPSRNQTKFLGYATSSDGVHWDRHVDNPAFDDAWVEDMCVVKHDGTYYMFAEGLHDIAHLMTSTDGLRWQDHGSLDIRTTTGEPLSPGPYGTPAIWIEGSLWHLFYERGDRGIWLATSKDRRVWKNVQDDPVIALGPDAYDRHAVAMNQIVRHKGRYYGVYHANSDPKWKSPWTTCLAVSDDLVHWKKYPHNPVIASNDSSGVLVDDGDRLRLYTMHPAVKLWLPRGNAKLMPADP